MTKGRAGLVYLGGAGRGKKKITDCQLDVERSDKILITSFQMSDSDSRLVSSCQPQAPRPHDLMERNSLNELMAGGEWRSGRNGAMMK